MRPQITLLDKASTPTRIPAPTGERFRMTARGMVEYALVPEGDTPEPSSFRTRYKLQNLYPSMTHFLMLAENETIYAMSYDSGASVELEPESDYA